MIRKVVGKINNIILIADLVGYLTVMGMPAHLRQEKLLEMLNLKDAKLDSRHRAQLGGMDRCLLL